MLSGLAPTLLPATDAGTETRLSVRLSNTNIWVVVFELIALLPICSRVAS